MKYLLLTVMLCLAVPMVPQTAAAVEPGEVLDDPALEARAREISKDLRCLVCRNENIDESNAELAKDLRLLVRERLLAGDSNDGVIDYIVDRYGEYVLLNPTLTGANKLLWLAGPIMLLLALGVGIGFIRRREKGAEVDDLSDEEKSRLDALLKD